jgi:hypothetical protein
MPSFGASGLVAQLVLDREGEVRLHAGQHVVEVVGRDLDELAVLELRERLGGLTREVAEHAHEEGQLLHLDRAAGLDLVEIWMRGGRRARASSGYCQPWRTPAGESTGLAEGEQTR